MTAPTNMNLAFETNEIWAVFFLIGTIDRVNGEAVSDCFLLLVLVEGMC